MISLNCTVVWPANAAPFGLRLTTRRGLDSLQRGLGAHGRNGRGPTVDQEVCPDDVRRIVRREVNCQLRDFHRIGQPLARIVCTQQPLDRIALLFAWKTTEHRRVSRAYNYHRSSNESPTTRAAAPAVPAGNSRRRP